MKKHLILTSLAAIIATTGVAGAETTTDVTFGGNYTNASGSTVNVMDSVAAESYTYTKSDGTTRTVGSQATDPTLADFTYTDKDGNPADLSVGGTELTAENFSGTTAADGTNVISNQTIAAGKTISRSNYEYVDGKGETVTLGDSARSFTETVALNSTYATVESVDVTDGSAAPVLAGTMYSYTDPDTGAVYHLNATGDEWVDANNLVVRPDAGTPQEAARDAMVAAFAADSAAITAAKTTVDGYATAEATAFAAADGVYTTDSTTINTLTTNYGTYTTAKGLLADAQSAQSEAQTAKSNNDTALNNAQLVYNAPILDTIDDAIDTSVASGSVKTALDGKANISDLGSAAYTDSTAYATAAQGTTADTTAATIATYGDVVTHNVSEFATAAQGELADSALQLADITKGSANGTIRVKDKDVAVFGLGSAAYADMNAFDLAGTAEAKAGAAEANANAYTDTVAAGLRADFATADINVLNSANAYTHSKVKELERNVSGGVAAATALSAVSVGNVERGEVSVGGGYGYYNGQSAMAFGAAMGLSDSWSINAGAGLASGDSTQFSIRAGTNYKFKLF